MSCERIDAGHEGIQVNLYGTGKGVQDISLVTGMVWYNPFTETVYEFPTYMQTIDYEPFLVNAKDGSSFTVDPTLSFYIKTGNTPNIFKKFRKNIDEITMTTLYNYTKDAFRIQMNKYSTEEIISNRDKFETDVQKTLASVFVEDGFVLEQMTSGLIYPKIIVEAVDRKNKAVQDAIQAENELKIAEALAKKKIIEAESEAKANNLKSQTLNTLLIQQLFIEKWDGKTPLYGNSPQFFKQLNN
jgi:regulator of protease activity HflC (stomatin/prohibitin superfamily)